MHLVDVKETPASHFMSTHCRKKTCCQRRRDTAGPSPANMFPMAIIITYCLTLTKFKLQNANYTVQSNEYSKAQQHIFLNCEHISFFITCMTTPIPCLVSRVKLKHPHLVNNLLPSTSFQSRKIVLKTNSSSSKLYWLRRGF